MDAIFPFQNRIISFILEMKSCYIFVLYFMFSTKYVFLTVESFEN